MRTFIITLLICSVAMSALLYMAPSPLLSKRYSPASGRSGESRPAPTQAPPAPPIPEGAARH